MRKETKYEIKMDINKTMKEGKQIREEKQRKMKKQVEKASKI
jgi:hypothetical protein